MTSAYPDFSWFVRAVRVLPIVAGAVIAGGAIGGFSVFAVDRALAPPQPIDSSSAASAAVNKPVRVIGTPPPNAIAAASAPAPATPPATPPQTNASTQSTSVQSNSAQVTSTTPAPVPPSSPQESLPPQVTPPAQAASNTQPNTPPKAWPDAMSRAHPTAQSETTAAVPSQSTPVAATPDQQPANQQAFHQQATEKRASNETVPVKYRRQLPSGQTASPSFDNKETSDRETTDRVAVRRPLDRQHAATTATVNARPAQPDAQSDPDDSGDDDATASNQRPVYNYYGGRSSGDPRYSDRTRVIIRRVPPPSRRVDDDTPRPEPFWGFRERNDGDDD